MARTVNYFTLAEMIGRIPVSDRDAALDDDGDGEADAAVITAVIEAACDEVDTFYAIRQVPLPVDTAANPLAKQAAIWLATEILYTRRGEPAERNPHHKTVEAMRAMLRRVAEGTMTVVMPGAEVPSASDSAVPGDVVSTESEPARTFSRKFAS